VAVPRVLTEPIRVDIVLGRRILAREWTIDIGIRIEDLHGWHAALRGPTWRPNWVIAESGAGNTILRATPGFDYDGASIPGWIQSTIMGPKEDYEPAALPHDLLYTLQAPKAAADCAFWQIASHLEKVTPRQASAGWAALRAFGGAAYRSHAR
jgi:hypothetical protein